MESINTLARGFVRVAIIAAGCALIVAAANHAPVLVYTALGVALCWMAGSL